MAMVANPPEQWKRYDEKYWVSDQGRVKHVYKTTEHYMTPQKRDENDKSLRVKVNGKYVSLRRMVWETFNGPVPEGYAIINKNGCHTMNELYNLICVPMKDGININREAKKKKVIDLDTGIVYPSMRSAAEYLHTCHSTISYCCKKKRQRLMYNLEEYDEEKHEKLVKKFIRS